jgi:hypothetical protein
VVVRIDLRYEIAQRLFSPNLQTPPAAASSAPAKQGTAAAATTAATPAATPAQGDGSQKKKCQTTRLFGGKGGAAFDHGTNRGRIKKITVYANRKSVDGIGITYDATRNMAVRNGTGKDGDSLELADGEYVNKFTVGPVRWQGRFSQQGRRGVYHRSSGRYDVVWYQRPGRKSVGCDRVPLGPVPDYGIAIKYITV